MSPAKNAGSDLRSAPSLRIGNLTFLRLKIEVLNLQKWQWKFGNFRRDNFSVRLFSLAIKDDDMRKNFNRLEVIS